MSQQDLHGAGRARPERHRVMMGIPSIRGLGALAALFPHLNLRHPHGDHPTRPLGKGRDRAWRESCHFHSRRTRANRRKAALKAK